MTQAAALRQLGRHHDDRPKFQPEPGPGAGPAGGGPNLNADSDRESDRTRTLQPAARTAAGAGPRLDSDSAAAGVAHSNRVFALGLPVARRAAARLGHWQPN